MTVITPLPIRIVCSECETTLLDGHIDVEAESDISRSWMLVDSVNLRCLQCNAPIREASDDFTRILDHLDEKLSG